MDWAFVISSAVLASVIQTAVIIVLYQKWIIPHIISGVKAELMISIEGWVKTMTDSLSDRMSEEIDAKMTSIKKAMWGKRGNNGRMMALAQSYLSSNLTDDVEEGTPEYDEIITAAVAQYSKPIVDAILDKIRPKKDDRAAAAAIDAAAGWC